MRKLFLYLLLALTALFWGSSWIVVKSLTADLDPILIATGRFLLVSVMFIPVALWLHVKGERLEGKDVGMLILLGIFGVALLYILQYSGVNLTTAINASLMTTFNPTVTLLLSSFFLREKIDFKKVAAILIAFLGAFLVITNGDMNFGTKMSDITGSILSLLSTCCWAVYTVMSKKAVGSHSAIFLVVYASIFGTLLLLPVAFLTPTAPKLLSLSLYDAGWLFYLAVTCTVFGYFAWSYSLERIDASEAAIFIYLVPLSSILLSYIFLGERLAPYSALGAVLIFAGVYYSTKEGSEKY
ncbi:EamA family transporter [Candidatus Micrarchaeota archaeon]|nr:EamA family transporter [Candidatus Micrarchaeota archaeon]